MNTGLKKNNTIFSILGLIILTFSILFSTVSTILGIIPWLQSSYMFPILTRFLTRFIPSVLLIIAIIISCSGKNSKILLGISFILLEIFEITNCVYCIILNFNNLDFWFFIEPIILILFYGFLIFVSFKGYINHLALYIPSIIVVMYFTVIRIINVVSYSHFDFIFFLNDIISTLGLVLFYLSLVFIVPAIIPSKKN